VSCFGIAKKEQEGKMRSMPFQAAAVRTVLCLMFVLVYAVSSYAQLAGKATEATLSNGLKVILLENHKAPLVTFQVWYRVGSRNEEWGKTGLSHMLEHMMFKGTKKTGPEEFSRIIQENGGNDNAFTSRDYTAYFENLSSDRAGVAIGLESDRMENLRLRDEDFRTEIGRSSDGWKISGASPSMMSGRITRSTITLPTPLS
jgi:predicted Zn-dependent peptidase